VLLGSGRLEMNNIRLVRLLGRGSYGTVYLGEDVARGGRVAVKIISTDSEEALSSVRNEIEALQELKHPNIIELFSVQGGPPPVPAAAPPIRSGPSKNKKKKTKKNKKKKKKKTKKKQQKRENQLVWTRHLPHGAQK
jgi:hypothetical protein